MHIEQLPYANYKHPGNCKCNYREPVCPCQADQIHCELVRAGSHAREPLSTAHAIVGAARVVESDRATLAGDLLDSHAVHRTVHHLGQLRSYY